MSRAGRKLPCGASIVETIGHHTALQGNAAHVGFDPIIMAAITANERDPDTSGSESP